MKINNRSEEESLKELSQKLLEAEEFIKNSKSVSNSLKKYVLFLIAKHDILLENIVNESAENSSKVDKIPLIRI